MTTHNHSNNDSDVEQQLPSDQPVLNLSCDDEILGRVESSNNNNNNGRLNDIDNQIVPETDNLTSDELFHDGDVLDPESIVSLAIKGQEKRRLQQLQLQQENRQQHQGSETVCRPGTVSVLGPDARERTNNDEVDDHVGESIDYSNGGDTIVDDTIVDDPAYPGTSVNTIADEDTYTTATVTSLIPGMSTTPVTMARVVTMEEQHQELLQTIMKDTPVAEAAPATDGDNQQHKHDNNVENNEWTKRRRWKVAGTAFLVLVVMVIGIGAAVVVTTNTNDEDEKQQTSTAIDPLVEEAKQDPLWQFLNEESMSLFGPATEIGLVSPTSPQFHAYEWLQEHYEKVLLHVNDDSTTTTITNTADSKNMAIPLLSNTIQGYLLQVYAMATFFYSTNGQWWNERGRWMDPTESFCDWSRGVNMTVGKFGNFSCSDSRNSIVNLPLAELDLVGTIPPELFFLSDLEVLDVNENFLSGTVPTPPEKAGVWPKLQRLIIDENRLTGTIPTTLATLGKSLIYMKISRNSLIGTLPTELAALTNLQYLAAHKNQLVGSFPDEYSAWSKVEEINFSDNSFKGTVPEAYSNWTSIISMDFDNNKLSNTTTCGPQICAFVEQRLAELDEIGFAYEDEDDGLLTMSCGRVDCPCATVCCDFGTCVQMNI